MKKIILCILTISLMCSGIQAQKLDYANKTIGDIPHKILTPTLHNLITLVNCSQSDFISLMKQYGYKHSDIEPADYTYIVYDNNGVDYYLYNGNGVGINYIEHSEIDQSVAFKGKLNKVFPQNALANLAKELQPYYLRQLNGVDEFVIQEQKGGYLIRITTENGMYFVRIYHFDE